MRYALRGREKWLIRKSRFGNGWGVAVGADGCPLAFPQFFATWREAMDWATKAEVPA